MICLKSKNLIFFKTRKTAGTSIEIALSTNAVGEDIVTPLKIQDELIRLSRYSAIPRNWSDSVEAEEEFLKCHRAILEQSKEGSELREKMIRNVIRSHTGRFKQSRRYHNHMSPHLLKQDKKLENYESFFKITATRHPYEQLVSHAYYRADLKDPSVTDHFPLEEIEVLLSRPSSNAKYCFEDGKPICDFYIRYEHLEEDLAVLEKKFGLSLCNNLPFTKHQIRQDRRPAREILTADQKRRCFERSRLEFEFFGYEA